MVQCPELCGRIASSLTTSAPSTVSNSSTASSPTTPSSAASRSASCPAALAVSRVQTRRGRDHLDADPVALHGLHDRPRRALAERRPRHQRGQLPPHRHALLDQDRDSLGEVAAGEVAGLVEIAGQQHAAAVVAAARGLEHDRLAVRRTPRARRRRSPRRSAESAPRWPPAAGASPACPGRGSAPPGGGATLTPSATSFSSSSVGTCSWSKVNASAPSAARRSASRSVCEPITTSGVTCAAGSSGVTASTRSVWPRAIAD